MAPSGTDRCLKKRNILKLLLELLHRQAIFRARQTAACPHGWTVEVENLILC